MKIQYTGKKAIVIFPIRSMRFLYVGTEMCLCGTPAEVTRWENTSNKPYNVRNYHGTMCLSCLKNSHPRKWREYVLTTIRKKFV